MFEEFKEILSVFNAHQVKYLIIGGYAVSHHAQPRATKDIDIFIQPDAANALAVYQALAEFGAPLENLKAEDLIEPDSFFRMGSPPRMVDILPSIAGVSFDEVWENKVEVEIDAESGLKCYFISGDDLITAKLASGRPQDIADVDAIRQAKLLLFK